MNLINKTFTHEIAPFVGPIAICKYCGIHLEHCSCIMCNKLKPEDMVKWDELCSGHPHRSKEEVDEEQRKLLDNLFGDYETSED